MHDHSRRLKRLEWQHLSPLAADAATPLGLTAGQILDEAQRIFSLPDDQQRAALSRTYAELDEAEAQALGAIRRRYARILCDQRRTR